MSRPFPRCCGLVNEVGVENTGGVTRTEERAAGRGRPRSRDGGSGDTRRDLLVAAGELFLDRGVARTTMSAIAERAGINQSSAYYWFAGKEAVLAALAEDNRASLKVAREQAAADAPAADRLYRVVRADIAQMLTVALPFHELERAATASPEDFPSFAADYAELRRLLAVVIASGVASGEFPAVSPQSGADAVFALAEGLALRHYGAADRAGDVAHLGAEMAVRMMTSSPVPAARARLAVEADG